MFNLEWTLNLGTVLTFIIIGLSSYFVMKAEMAHLKVGMNEIKDNLKALNQVIIDLAVQDKRLDNQGEQLNLLRFEMSELKHGKGLVIG